MAISVNTVYERVSVLAKKSQNGYQSGADFNSDLIDANLTLYEYYVNIFEETQRILDALIPFVVEAQLPLTQSTFSATTPFPSNYAHRLEIGVLKTTNSMKNDCGGKGCGSHGCHSCNSTLVTTRQPVTVYPPDMQLYPCDYLVTNEVMWTLSSAIRKPSIQKGIYRHTFKDGLIHVYPKETKRIYFKYLKQPATPVWGSTFVSNANGDFEQYNPAASTDLEFPPQEISNIVDLMCFYLGIELRETPLINFAKQKQTQPLVQ